MKGNTGRGGLMLFFRRRLLTVRKRTLLLLLLVGVGLVAGVPLVMLAVRAPAAASNNVHASAASGAAALATPNSGADASDAARRQALAMAESEAARRDADLKQREERLRDREQEVEQLRQRLGDLERRLSDQGSPSPAPEQSQQPPTPAQPQTAAGGVGSADVVKQTAVKKAMQHGYGAYERIAFGTDELLPLDGRSNNWMGLGLTILDSLDTLWIMDMKDEFGRAREWIAANLDFNKNRDVSLFETTIRVMGGLLGAFELSRDKLFLDKARELADRFLPAFNTPTGIPRCAVNLQNGQSHNPSWTGGASILSEVGTLQLEFTYLAHHTGQSHYRDTAIKVFDVLDRATKPDGLYSVYVSPDNGQFTRQHVTLGALGDSFYEYLLKMSVMTGETRWRQMYDAAANAIRGRLVQKSNPNKLTYLAELIGGQLHHKMDHLVCFAGAMFALASDGSSGAAKAADLELAAGITETCWQMYARTATGIAPEIIKFEGGNDFIVPNDAHHYLLRPEAVEALFYMWRYTHDQKYRDWGWSIFTAIEKYCRVQNGYSGIRDVTSTTPTHDNLQQSFFLAETLKYLYLLFSDDSLIPLQDYVFNTEAHIFGVLKK
eukprot:TRINITY_DN5057_c0_g1_i1.p1 TRINITY_DN5057_c0_g1~~TRINITY_DN5057_c0_g1_i1.p1  ORF type:complete len:606 (-),score=254.80 TRINITY_DN5057_c0_g1_i1:179-1996(-)